MNRQPPPRKKVFHIHMLVGWCLSFVTTGPDLLETGEHDGDTPNNQRRAVTHQGLRNNSAVQK